MCFFSSIPTLTECYTVLSDVHELGNKYRIYVECTWIYIHRIQKHIIIAFTILNVSKSLLNSSKYSGLL